MQNQAELERIANRFLDEVEKKFEGVESYFDKREIEVPIHPEIYEEAIEALEMINELGKNRMIRVEKVDNGENCQYKLKFIRIEQK